jgi:hypothetical protein
VCEVKARPILFSPNMVCALLAGRKTQTRRIIKAPTTRGEFLLSFNHGTPEFNFGPDDRKPGGDLRWHRCPYGEAGDLLWVRESHYVIGEHAGPWPGSRWTHYLADLSNNLGDTDHQWLGPWKPSIHMPRAASRLTLRVADARVERLQAINDDDARAEGVQWDHYGWMDYEDYPRRRKSSALQSFETLWRSINGPDSWTANPWTWAVSFEVIHANVDTVLKETA